MVTGDTVVAGTCGWPSLIWLTRTAEVVAGATGVVAATLEDFQSDQTASEDVVDEEEVVTGATGIVLVVVLDVVAGRGDGVVLDVQSFHAGALDVEVDTGFGAGVVVVVVVVLEELQSFHAGALDDGTGEGVVVEEELVVEAGLGATYEEAVETATAGTTEDEDQSPQPPADPAPWCPGPQAPGAAAVKPARAAMIVVFMLMVFGRMFG